MKELENMLYDSSRRCILLAVDVLEQKPELFNDMLSLCMESKYPMAMRAARVIQFYCDKFPETILNHIDYVIPLFIKTNVDGVKRSIMKIFIDRIDVNLIPDLGLVLSKCYDWLLSDKEPIAVRVYSLELINKIALSEPDLFLELKIVIEQMDFDNYPSLRYRTQRILKYLRKKEMLY